MLRPAISAMAALSFLSVLAAPAEAVSSRPPLPIYFEGFVVRPDGSPAVGAAVFVTAFPEDVYPAEISLARTVTDQLGMFRLAQQTATLVTPGLAALTHAYFTVVHPGVAGSNQLEGADALVPISDAGGVVRLGLLPEQLTLDVGNTSTTADHSAPSETAAVGCYIEAFEPLREMQQMKVLGLVECNGAVQQIVLKTHLIQNRGDGVWRTKATAQGTTTSSYIEAQAIWRCDRGTGRVLYKGVATATIRRYGTGTISTSDTGPTVREICPV